MVSPLMAAWKREQRVYVALDAYEQKKQQWSQTIGTTHSDWQQQARVSEEGPSQPHLEINPNLLPAK